MDLGVAFADAILHLTDFPTAAVDGFSLDNTRGLTGNALSAVVVDLRLANLNKRGNNLAVTTVIKVLR